MADFFRDDCLVLAYQREQKISAFLLAFFHSSKNAAQIAKTMTIYQRTTRKAA